MLVFWRHIMRDDTRYRPHADGHFAAQVQARLSAVSHFDRANIAYI